MDNNYKQKQKELMKKQNVEKQKIMTTVQANVKQIENRGIESKVYYETGKIIANNENNNVSKANCHEFNFNLKRKRSNRK